MDVSRRTQEGYCLPTTSETQPAKEKTKRKRIGDGKKRGKEESKKSNTKNIGRGMNGMLKGGKASLLKAVTRRRKKEDSMEEPGQFKHVKKRSP